jgi:hypothetical protein
MTIGAIAATISAIMATTTSNSIKVNAAAQRL